MKLLRVEYELFEWEESRSDLAQVHRQVRLFFSDAPPLFVSWTSARQHSESDRPYSVDFATESFFKDGPPLVADASGFPIWSDLIGKRVDVEFLGTEFQVLRLSAGSAAAYCSTWPGDDVVRLSSRAPDCILLEAESSPTKPVQPTRACGPRG